MSPHVRIARPVSNPDAAADMYCRGLGLRVVGRFADHDGFDGVMLGVAGSGYHFEFTYRRAHPITPTPTAEDLVVLYIPDAEQWKAACANMAAAGFVSVESMNPYWEAHGRTFLDPDGYRTVLQCARWTNVEKA